MFEQKRATSPPALIRSLSGLVLIALLAACSADEEPAEQATAGADVANAAVGREIVAEFEKGVAETRPVRPAPAITETTKPERSGQAASQNAYDLLQDLEVLASEKGADNREQTSDLLQRLRLEGANALNPIREALLDGDHFADIPLELRQSLLNVLLSLGVPEVEEVALQLLASKPAPAEVLQLALYLEGLQPGQYSDSIRLAAEQTLIDTPPSTPLTPEFYALLGELGTRETAMLLAETPLHDDAYASFALAAIPDGSGLLQLEQEARLFEIGRETVQGDLAIQLIAQEAAEHTHAGETLLELAENGAIPIALWPYVLDIVAGNLELTLFEPPASQFAGSHTYFSPQGNQVIYRATLLPEQLDTNLQSQRLYLLERLQEYAPPSSG